MQNIIYLSILFICMIVNNQLPLFDFTKESDLSNWYIVDDVVMGGRSDGYFEINEKGHGLFHGEVSLENNGGFSSVRYRFEQQKIDAFQVCKIRLKGDGKAYQFRAKTDKYDRHSYVYHFETSGEWEVISIPLNEMYPSFRGMQLDMPNFPSSELEEVAFLIANKKAESFKLEVDWIGLE